MYCLGFPLHVKFIDFIGRSDIKGGETILLIAIRLIWKCAEMPAVDVNRTY